MRARNGLHMHILLNIKFEKVTCAMTRVILTAFNYKIAEAAVCYYPESFLDTVS